MKPITNHVMMLESEVKRCAKIFAKARKELLESSDWYVHAELNGILLVFRKIAGAVHTFIPYESIEYLLARESIESGKDWNGFILQYYGLRNLIFKAAALNVSLECLHHTDRKIFEYRGQLPKLAGPLIDSSLYENVKNGIDRCNVQIMYIGDVYIGSALRFTDVHDQTCKTLSVYSCLNNICNDFGIVKEVISPSISKIKEDCMTVIKQQMPWVNESEVVFSTTELRLDVSGMRLQQIAGVDPSGVI